jgi:ribosomal protein L17
MAPPDEKQQELFVPMKCFVLHATTALGTAVVRRFAREGPALILTDITSQRDPMAALAKEASMQGASRCMIYGGDIYSSSVEQEIIDSALSTVGDVDVLVIVPPEEGRSGARTARHSAVVRALLDALAPRMEAKGGGYILAVLREGRDGRLASDLEAVRQVSTK